MGQKVHPFGMRIGIVKDWNSIWYADAKNYVKNLNNDLKIREFLNKSLKNAFISTIKIERPAKNARVTIYTSRPGIIIGKKGEEIDKLRSILTKKMGIPVQINIEEIRKPELDAKLVASNICQQLEKRIMFRRAMKRAIQSTMKVGAEGVKISISGRLGGAEIARKEWLKEGRIPLHTFRANIEYASCQALTTYGILGVKVWIYKGDILPNQKNDADNIDNKTKSLGKLKEKGE